LIKKFPTVWEKISENRRGRFFFDSHCTLCNTITSSKN